MIVAGGTGGHIFPALILYKEFKKLKHEVFFVCREEDKRKFNERLKPISDFIYPIKSAGLKRKSLEKIFIGILTLFLSLKQSYSLIKNLKPDLIIGFGGYISFAPSLIAHWLGKKVVLFEQNSIPGLSNKMINKFSDKTFLNYEYTRKWFSKGIYLSQPVNNKIGSITKSRAQEYWNVSKKKKTLFILGGSQGAQSINELILENKEALSDFNILWSTGKKHLKKIRNKVDRKNIVVRGFINKMEWAWAVADLVIARAGASTISEIKQAGVPSILIPYPFATENHQYFNALEIEKKGMGFVIEEKKINFSTLKNKIDKIIKNLGQYKKRLMKSKIKNEQIAKIILKSV